MRIITGKHKSRVLKTLDGLNTRPMMDKMKESVFQTIGPYFDGGEVLDLFGGSGSTLIACEQLNRKCYMMELDPHYIDVIIQRWENFTGEKAVLLNREENEQ